MNLRVRPATDEDLVEITALYAQEVREGVATYEYIAPDIDEMARRRQTILAQGYPYLVAELDGCFAGYGYASSYRARGLSLDRRGHRVCQTWPARTRHRSRLAATADR